MKRTFLLAILLFTIASCVEQDSYYHDFGILHFPAEGGTKEFSFNVDDNWEITSEASDWIKISPLKGAKGENVKIEVKKNTLPIDRTEIITVRFSDKESGEITILQDANKE